ADQGIRFTDPATEDAVAGNLVFSPSPISGSIKDSRSNITNSVANAPMYVRMPTTVLANMDFFPLPGRVASSVIDMTKFRNDTDYQLDYNHNPKGNFTYRGAYAGDGVTPAGTITPMLQMTAAMRPDGGGSPGADASPGSRADAGATTGVPMADA